MDLESEDEALELGYRVIEVPEDLEPEARDLESEDEALEIDHRVIRVLEAYDAAAARAERFYHKIVAPVREAYDAAVARVEQAYGAYRLADQDLDEVLSRNSQAVLQTIEEATDEEALDRALQAEDEAAAPARKACHEAVARVEQAYEAEALALKTYNEAVSLALRVYDVHVTLAQRIAHEALSQMDTLGKVGHAGIVARWRPRVPLPSAEIVEEKSRAVREALDAARVAHSEVQATALMTYVIAMADARKTYDEMAAQARRAYEADVQTAHDQSVARQAYFGSLDAAWKTRAKAMVDARRTYQNAIDHTWKALMVAENEWNEWIHHIGGEAERERGR